jgi:hypothetical protein
MYQNMFHGDDTRLRNFPIEHTYAPQHHVIFPQIRLADEVRQWAGEAFIALGVWIKPHRAHRSTRRHTSAWQGR